MESDERFKHLASDPRFKALRRKQKKIHIDERFKSMFTDEKFGRRENLERFYQIEEDETKSAKKPKLEDDKGDETKDNEVDETTSDGDLEQGDEETDSEVDGQHEDRQIESGCETPQSALSSSSDESESDDEHGEEPDLDQQVQYDWQPLDHDAERTDIKSNRLAILNLDWNNLDINDIYVLLNSIRPPLSVKMYVSEFGKERLAKEAVDGPDLPEVDEVEEEITALENQLHHKRANEYEDADDMYNIRDEAIRERLRKYQLTQMKYYYAIAEFDSVESAQAVYKELDGIEYEGSSLELDLRFVPDEIEFDPVDVKAECKRVPDLATYKAPQFIASALQQTTVKFTWDETDVKRQQKLRKAYTKEELEKEDLEAYLASDTEDEDDEGEVAASKYKELVMQLDEADAAKKKVDVDIEWDEDNDDDDEDDNNDDSAHDDDDDGDDDDDDDGDDDDDDDGDDDDDDDGDGGGGGGGGGDEDEDEGDGKDGGEDEHEDGLDLIAMDFKEREEFKFNPDDDRFKAVYDSGLYNLDPSHPNYKQTEATKLIAERKREKRRRVV